MTGLRRLLALACAFSTAVPAWAQFGPGSFETLPFGLFGTELADLYGNGDHYLVTYGSQDVYVSRHLGGGTFGDLELIFSSGAERFSSGRLVDIDDDGDLDVCMTGYNLFSLWQGFIRIYYNDGAGGFTSQGWAVFGDWAEYDSPRFGDLDGDGGLDLVVYDNSIGRISTVADVSSSFPTAFTVNSRGPRDFVIVDVDGDGDEDLYWSQPIAPRVGWFESLGSTTSFQPIVGLPAPLDSGIFGVAADLDGDGVPELIGSDSGAVLGTGYVGGGLHGTPFVIAPALTSLGGRGVSTGDVDLDGDLDIITLDGTGGHWVENEGALQFGGPSAISAQMPGMTRSFLLDADGDGDLDFFGLRETGFTGSPPAAVGYAENLTLQAGCVTNASFESGNLFGWTAVDVPGAFVPIEAAGPGENPGFGMFDTEPTDGDFVFRTGFDGPGPFTITLAQDVAVGAGNRQVTFNYRAGWTILNPTAVLDRTFSVVVRDPATGAALQTDLLLTAAAQTTNFDTGSLVATIDLSAFEGQTVGLSFEWYVPESNTGPAHFQLDGLRCSEFAGENVGVNYCIPAPNSTGAPARMTASGSATAAHNNLTLRASLLPPNQFGIFVTSMTQDFVPGAGGTSNGNLCLGGAIGRYLTILNSGVAGNYSMSLDLTAIPQGSGTMAATSGQTWNFQSWTRDSVGLGSNFTDGVSVTFL